MEQSTGTSQASPLPMALLLPDQEDAEAPVLKCTLLLSCSISVFFLVFGPSIKQKLLPTKGAFSETEPHRKTWTTNIPCWGIIHLQV